MNFSCFTKRMAIILMLLFCITQGHYCCVHCHAKADVHVWYQCLLPHTHSPANTAGIPFHEHSCTGGESVTVVPEDGPRGKHTDEISPLDMVSLSTHLLCEKARAVAFCTPADREYGRNLRLYLLHEILII